MHGFSEYIPKSGMLTNLKLGKVYCSMNDRREGRFATFERGIVEYPRNCES